MRTSEKIHKIVYIFSIGFDFVFKNPQFMQGLLGGSEAIFDKGYSEQWTFDVT